MKEVIRKLLLLLNVIISAFILICAWPIIVKADPGTITLSAILISLAVSAATTAGSMLLTRILTPKPKGNELGKIQGQTQLSDSSWNLVENEIYGGPFADGIGGVATGVNVIWMNKEGIREKRQTVSSGGGQGGKGPPKPAPDVQITYDCDIACLVGAGPLEVLRIKFNDDIVYSIVAAGPGFDSRQYEAEDLVNNTFHAGAAIVTDSNCSGGKKVVIETGEWVQFNHVNSSATQDFDLTLYYVNNGDLTTIGVSVNGGAADNVDLPDSINILNVAEPLRVTLAAGTNTIRLTNVSGIAAGIDRIFALIVPVIDPGDDPNDPNDPFRKKRLESVTGMVDDLFPVERSYDPAFPPNPYTPDPNPALRHAAISQASGVDASIVTTVNAGFYAELAIYEGNEDQEPDPIISADVDGQYGAGSTPAYLNHCYFRISKLNISKYNGFPNVVVTARNKVLNTIEDILVFRAKKVGLTDADLNLSAAGATACRGYLINQQEAPKETMEAFAQVFNFDFVETPDGILEAVDLTDRTIVDTILDNELGAFVKGESEGDANVDLVTTQVPAEDSLWKYVKVGFFNPLLEFQDDSRQDVYPFTDSETTQSVSWNMTLLPDEAMQIARRTLQMHWAAISPDAFTLPDSRIWLYPSNRVNLPINGQNRARRIMEIQGTFPGVLKVSAVPDELAIFAGASLTANPFRRHVLIPANTVGTFLDIPLLHPQLLPGLYIAACSRDQTSGTWTGATAYRFKGGDWQPMMTFSVQATFGRTVNAMADVPGTWLTVRQTPVRQFFYGSHAGGNGGDGALNREPTHSELGSYADRLRKEDPLIVMRALGRYLFLSDEYIARARTDVQFVTDMYSGYLNRDPNDPPDSDMTGRDAWVTYLGSHTRLQLIEQFEILPEFIARVDTVFATFFDTTSTVTIDLFSGEPSSITDSQAREGNGLWVFGNEATIVAQWTRDLTQPNRWVGTRMLRRLRGTDDDSDLHESGERCLLMNSAVQFVEMDPSDKDIPQTWKLVTAGSRIEDAAELSVTWHGLNIRPTQVINLLGQRVSSDLACTWDPGIEGEFVPEGYMIRIRDAATGVLKRTAKVVLNDGVPCIWSLYLDVGDETLVHMDPDGSIYTNVEPTGVLVYTSQPFFGDGSIKFEVDDRPFTLIGPVSSPPGLPIGCYIESAQFFGQPQYIDAEGATTGGTAGPFLRRLKPLTKLEIRIQNQHVEYYLDDVFWMRSFQHPIPPVFEVAVDFSASVTGAQALKKVRFIPAVPRQFVYTIDMQRTDFGSSPPLTVIVDVTQISSDGVEGPGARIIA